MYRRAQLWLSNNYTSCNLGSSSDVDDDQASGSDNEGITGNIEDEEEQQKKKAIHYVIGDVMRPQNADGHDAVIVHCVG